MGLFEQFPYTNFHELNLDWVISRFNELIAAWKEASEHYDTLAAAYEDFKNWFDTVSLQDEVDNKIEEMLNDGTLDALFSKLYYAVELSLTGRTFLYEPLDSGRTGQGMCVAGDYLITTDYLNNNTPTLFRVYDMNRNLINSQQFSTLHSNDMTYNPDTGEIVVLSSGNLFVFDFNYSTGVLTAKPTITAPYQLTAIGYDKSSKTYYAINGVTYELYKSADLTDWTLITSLPARGTGQGMCCDGGFIYFCESSDYNYISKYTMDGTTAGLYYFDSWSWNELEDVDIYKGNMIISSTMRSNYNAYYSVPILFGASIDTPTVFKTPGLFRNDYVNIYIDQSLATCGDGSADHPFNDLGVALKYAAESNAAPNLHIVGSYNKEFTIRNYPNQITITGETGAVINERVRLFRCSSVLFAGDITFGTTSYDVQLQIEECDNVIFAGTFAFNNTEPNIRVVASKVSGRTLTGIHVVGTSYTWSAVCSDSYNSRFDGLNPVLLGQFGATPSKSGSVLYPHNSHVLSITGVSLPAGQVTNINLADYVPDSFPVNTIAFAIAMPIYTPTANDIISCGYDRGNHVIKLFSTAARNNQTVIVFITT